MAVVEGLHWYIDIKLAFFSQVFLFSVFERIDIDLLAFIYF